MTNSATGGDQAAGSGCCSDGPQAHARASRARRLVAISGLVGLAVTVLGLAMGGWAGAALVALVAAGIAQPLVTGWGRLSLNDRLLRIAVVTLLVGLAVVRALPR